VHSAVHTAALAPWPARDWAHFERAYVVHRLTPMHSSEGFPRSYPWRLVNVSGAWASDGHALVPGRQQERLRLINALDATLLDVAPSLVTISAAAGMGKSRLIAETVELARASGFDGRIFAAGALPGDRDHALVARLLRRRLGCDMSDAPDRAHWCELFAADASEGPLCLVLEDLHHADAASLATLNALLLALGGPALILCSAWPGFFDRRPPFPHIHGTRRDHLELGATEH
jgi:hypothetical protein